MQKKITLICTPLRFFTKNDEELFFNWLQKVTCIKEYKGIGRELHLSVASTKISDSDLLDLMGIFERYKFDTRQLKVFMTNDNKDLFEES